MTRSASLRQADPALATLRQDRARFLAFAFAGGDLLLEVDGAGRITYATGAAQVVTGVEQAALISCQLVDLVAPDQRSELQRQLLALPAAGRLAPQCLTFMKPRPHQVWLAGHGGSAESETCHLSLRLGAAKLPEPLARERFEASLMERVQQASDDERLTMLDLSELGALADRLDQSQLGSLRAEIGQCIGRYGVDEAGAGWLAGNTFGVVHDAALDPAALSAMIEAMTADADPAGRGVRATQATLSIGQDGLSASDAGQALLYAINRFAATKGQDFDIASLQDGFQGLVASTVARVAEIRGRVDTESFGLAFQPIVELRSRQVHHYELLTRLEDGCSPFEMVCFAEQTGLVIDLDLAICRRAFEVLQRPRKVSVSIAVNLSGRSLESELFVTALLALLDGTPEVRGRLLFELTESAAIVDPERVANVVRALRARGLPICLDDFGSGAAAFHYLRAFRFDYVKIDGAYIKSIDHRDQAILKGMIGMCRELGIATVAEMVETPLQAERLRRLKVDYAQGYLFGRPIAEAELGLR